jgi:dihydroxyacid dehydratase/phosphogluconate dehydratase
MDATSSIATRLPSRHMTDCALRAGSTDAALHFPAIDADGIGAQIFLAEIFKKTPYAAGLKPGGRDVAKDIFEIGGIPLPMTPLNVKLTGAGRVQRKTKWQARKTNHTSGAPVRAHEKQCYADI